MTERSVTLAVFPGGPFSGWVLYFNGFKRPTITSKSKGSGVSTGEYVNEALDYVRPDGFGHLGLLMINGKTGKRISPKGVELPDHLTEITEPFNGYGLEIIQYLFESAKAVIPPRPPKLKKFMPPVPSCEGEGEQASEEVIVICSDASIRGGFRDHGNLPAGTGWVIGHHDGGERVAVGYRSYPPMDTVDTNYLEMCGVRDALLHLAEAEDIHRSASRVVLYCDNIMVIRALTVGGSPERLSLLAVPILEAARELPLDIEFVWARGHSENRWNLMAHELAALAIQRL